MLQKIKISDFAKVKGGKRLPPNANLLKTPTSHPYIRARDIKDGRITSDDPVYVSDSDFQTISRYTISSGDVCITIVGNIGDVGITPDYLDGASLTENAVKLVNLKPGISAQYLVYALLSPDAQSQMKQSAAGAAQAKLGIYKVNEIKIPIPSESSQEKIASNLSAYDNLINNNRSQIRILELLIQSFYTEWFINYRFPGGNKNIGQNTIPKDWMLCRVGDVLQLNYGKALVESNRHSQGVIPVYGSSGVVGMHDVPLSSGPGIIVGRKGNVGSVFWSDEDFYVIDTAYFVTSSLPLRYLYRLLPTLNFINSDAAVPGLSRNQAYSLGVIIPPREILDEFVNLIEPFERKISSLKRQNINLLNSRNYLLPRIFSGEIKF